MSKNSKNKKYIIVSFGRYYSYNNGGFKEYQWRATYYTKEQLINRLALNNVYSKPGTSIMDRRVSKLFDKNSISNEAKTLLSNVECDRIYYIGYLRQDDDICNVSLDSMSAAIKEKETEVRKSLEARRKRAQANKRSESYTFRKDPVPRTGICYHGYGYYRAPKIHRLMVQSSIPEYKEFRKGNERKENLPTWDDRVRHIDKSWKTSYKCKRQWQKHMRKHAYTSYCDRKAYNMEWERVG